MIDEQQEQEEEYLRSKGWYKINQMLWNHKDYNYDCGHQTAIELQAYRDQNK